MHSLMLVRHRRVLCGTAMSVFLVTFLWVTSPAPASGQAFIARVAAGPISIKLAVNQATDTVYVANSVFNNCSLGCQPATITVIDGANNSATPIILDDTFVDFSDIAVNPVTNKIYVLTYDEIFVLDGATNAITVVHNPTEGLNYLAVNPVTNKIYAPNWYSGNVTVLDGATNAITTVTDPNASGPGFAAVNPLTNKIYVANSNSGNVTVIDGATNATTTVTDPNASGPDFIAVNRLTNRIYVANWNSGNVTIIDGATNATTTVPTGTNPNFVAVNPVTDKIYVSNWGSDTVTVIDGATNSITTVKDPNASEPIGVALDSVTNKIYVVNWGSGNMTVIDGPSQSTISVPATMPASDGETPWGPLGVGVNQATDRIYVLDSPTCGETCIIDWSGYVTVFDGAVKAPRLTLTPTSVTFPLLRTVGTTSLPLTVKLTNVSSVELDVTGINVTGPDPDDFAQSNNCTPSVAGGGSCLITLAFTPTAQGVRAASLSVSDYAIGGPQTVSLAGRGTILYWAPRDMYMGEEPVGTSSPVYTVKVSNAGTGPISLYSIGIAGVNPGDFTQTNTCGSSLNPGATCAIEVTFTPTAVGPRLGHVAIQDSAFGGTHWVGLLGQGE
jgi:YVTN family beta-propeller protein